MHCKIILCCLGAVNKQERDVQVWVVFGQVIRSWAVASLLAKGGPHGGVQSRLHHCPRIRSAEQLRVQSQTWAASSDGTSSMT